MIVVREGSSWFQDCVDNTYVVETRVGHSIPEFCTREKLDPYTGFTFICRTDVFYMRYPTHLYLQETNEYPLDKNGEIQEWIVRQQHDKVLNSLR